MARGLSSSVKTELATGIIDPVLLIDIEFSTPVYLTNASFDISSNISGTSRTYLSNGHLRSITGVNETNRPTKNTLSIRKTLPNLIKNYSIQSFFDVPCGDFNWMYLVIKDSKLNYLGSDIVKNFIKLNKTKYKC